MNLKITTSVYNRIIQHAQKESPIEACGYLAGKDGIICQFYAMKNIDNSQEHFSFDPAEQFEIIRKTREAGLEIIANYHSHPLTPARPSQEDIKLAHDPDIYYIIISLEGKPDIKSFKIHGSTVTKQIIEIIE